AAAGPVPAIGQQLALVGLPSAGLGPCAACHGVTRAAAKAYPLLEGQARWYLGNQMRVFRAGGRGTIAGEKVVDPMVAIARKLNDAQIDAVAAYYAAQPPAKVQSFAAREAQEQARP
ncbi:c-type cytochrome, partial [Sphingomonas sp.]|uniref:c-type cytochrome n=1 Tax=Sphingomonas sp. TaxID=28214 RepID=UPI0035BBACDA